MKQFAEHRLIHLFSEAMAAGAAMGAAAEGAMETGAEVAAESTEAVAETAAETPEAAQEFTQNQAGEMMSQANDGAAQFAENIGDSQAFADSMNAENSMMQQAGSPLDGAVDTVSSAVDSGADSLKSGVDDAASAIKGPAGDMGGAIGGQAGEAVSDILGEAMNETAGSAGEAAGSTLAEGAVDMTADAMRSGLESVATTAKDVVGNIGDTMKEMNLPDAGAQSPVADALKKVEGLLDSQAAAPMDERLPASVDPAGAAMRSIPKALEKMSTLAERIGKPGGGIPEGKATPGIVPDAPTDLFSQLPQPIQDLWKGIQDAWTKFTGIFDRGGMRGGTPPIVPEGAPSGPIDGMPPDAGPATPPDDLPGAQEPQASSAKLPEPAASPAAPEPTPVPEALRPSPQPVQASSEPAPDASKSPVQPPQNPAQPSMQNPEGPQAPEPQSTPEPASPERTWSNGARYWWMDEGQKGSLDKTIKAQDALNGDDKALHELADEQLQKEAEGGSWSAVGKKVGLDVGKTVAPDKTNAMLRSQVEQQYKDGLRQAAKENGLTEKDILELADRRREELAARQ